MISKSKLKYIQSLGHKKFRDEAGVFLVEGPKMVAEILQEKLLTVTGLYALQDWITANEQLVQRVSEQVEIVAVDEISLAKISQLTTPNKVVAVVTQQPLLPAVDTSQLTLVLDTIQDPGNLGTIIRIADWFGIRQLVCSQECADRYNPKVVQSTMGSIARVGFYYTDLPDFLKANNNTRIYAAALDGIPVQNLGKLGNGFLVIGNESKGISPEVMNLVNVRMTIPRIGQAESLNAAVATGIILSHVTG
ncbi:TrmH family RNA methyltransferase [Terrimonas rubra]|uniref:TrmH family RNA methyltransferase n=1 Tax=Terrimonas rubra TaxID=1035890 RepID=A0ABW6ABR3_9BACT